MTSKACLSMSVSAGRPKSDGVKPEAAVTLIFDCSGRGGGREHLLLALAQDAINSRHPRSRVAAKTLSMNVKTRRWKDGTGRVGRGRARSSRLAVEPTDDQHVAGPEGIERRLTHGLPHRRHGRGHRYRRGPSHRQSGS